MQNRSAKYHLMTPSHLTKGTLDRHKILFKKFIRPLLLGNKWKQKKLFQIRKGDAEMWVGCRYIIAFYFCCFIDQ
jgi:hypothetical protein